MGIATHDPIHPPDDSSGVGQWLREDSPQTLNLPIYRSICLSPPFVRLSCVPAREILEERELLRSATTRKPLLTAAPGARRLFFPLSG